MKKFTIYWLSGKREIVEGESIAEAFTGAGYSAGALRGVDFYTEGDSNEYYWSGATNKWVKEEKIK